MIRVIIPDSHGQSIARQAMQLFLHDLKELDPEEIVMLGDHVDCSGLFTTHKRSYQQEMEYSYLRDIEYAKVFLDAIQECAPRARIHYLEGNHELRVEKWAANTFDNAEDAGYLLSAFSPEVLLELKDREISYYRMAEKYDNISIPGTIQLGKCFFTHGICANKYATAKHLERFGANVVHGHTHRMQAHTTRLVAVGEIGAWCPGTLSELQPMYMHTNPSEWSNDYGVQLVNENSGTVLHVNVPICEDTSLLHPLLYKSNGAKKKRRKG